MNKNTKVKLRMFSTFWEATPDEAIIKRRCSILQHLLREPQLENTGQSQITAPTWQNRIISEDINICCSTGYCSPLCHCNYFLINVQWLVDTFQFAINENNTEDDKRWQKLIGTYIHINYSTSTWTNETRIHKMMHWCQYEMNVAVHHVKEDGRLNQYHNSWPTHKSL